MSKLFSAGLADHLTGKVTSLAECTRIIRRHDNTVFAFTSLDKPLTIDIGDGRGPITHVSGQPFDRDAISNNDELAVDNTQILGFFDPAFIDEQEVERGLFNRAIIQHFVVNWKDLSQGIGWLRSGWIGRVKQTPSGKFEAEFRGLTQAYNAGFTQVTTPLCRTVLGTQLGNFHRPNHACRIPLNPPVVTRSTAYAVDDFVKAAQSMNDLQFDSHLRVVAEDTIRDVSSTAATATIGSLASRTTVGPLAGVGSILFAPNFGVVDPSEAHVSFANTGGRYDIAGNQFTVRAKVAFDNLAGDSIQTIASQYGSTGGNRSWQLIRSGANIEFQVWDGAQTPTNTSRAFTWVQGVEYDVEVSRDENNDLRIFVDGVQQGATANVPVVLKASTSDVRIGKIRSAGGDDNPMSGRVDDFDLLIGIAVHTANFTPDDPIPPYVDFDATVAPLKSEDFGNTIYRCTVAGTTPLGYQPAYDATVGNPTVDGTATFVAERSWARFIEVIAPDVTEPRRIFTVAELTPNSGLPRQGFPASYFRLGVVVWETGNNAFVPMEVRIYTPDDGVTIIQTIELFEEMPFDIAVGDKARIYPGCDLTPATCKNTFANKINFQGEDFLPGEDSVSQTPDAKT
jgi:hypothetical protein